MKTSTASRLFYGGTYNPEQWPEATWQEDVQLMKRAGVNLVTLGHSSWPRLQPAAGKFDFQWLDHVLTLLHKNEVFINLSTGTALAPPWLIKQFPESLPAADARADAAAHEHYCPTHPGRRTAALALVRELATRYGRHPAVLMWHVSPGYGSQPGFCRCDHCATRFRLWLRQRHGSLERMAERWGALPYSDWDEIPLPGTVSRSHPGCGLDYRRFVNAAVLDCFLAERAILNEITPERPVTTGFGGEHGLLETLDYFEWSQHIDFISFNSYPDPLSADPAEIAFAYDLQRGLGRGRPWLLTEQAPSHVNCRTRSAVKRPGQMRLWSYQALAHGADGIMFFQWRAAESGPEHFHSGMLPHGGTETRTFREITQLGAELKRLSPLRDAKTAAEVALVVDWENMWALSLDSQPAHLNYSEIVRSYYRALFEPDVAVDIVRPEADLTSYKLVVAPSLHLVRPTVPENFEAFVDRGGTLVMTFFSGIMDANARVFAGGYPGPFRRLLGIRVEEFDAFGAQLRHIKSALRSGRCSWWADVIHPESAEALATFAEDFYAHQPAITRNAFGRGLAYYVGTQPEQTFLRSFLAELCVDSGVRAPLRAPAGIEVTSRSNEHGQFLFLLNHNTTIQFVDLSPRSCRDLLSGDVMEGQCELPPFGVRVLQLINA